jgi:hypothetical protein
MHDKEGQVIVTDLGLAYPLVKEGPSLTSSGRILGTVLYFSPEQAAGARQLTPASDIFSLGVVLYELLSDTPPFAGSLLEVAQAIREAAPTPLEELRPDLDPALAAICRKAMAREPAQRYASMDAFADDLERFLAGRWTPPPRPGPDTIDLPVPWRRRAVVIFIAATLLCAGVLLISPFFGRDAAPPGESRPLVSSREPIGLRGQLQRMHDDLDQLKAPDRPHVRYFSLMAVHDNPYVSDADFAAHLDALQRVLNRFSHKKLKVPIYPTDATGSLLRVDLRDLDWHPAIEWPLLLQAEPYGVRYDAVHPDETLRKLARETYGLAGINSLFDAPCVRADWFIVAASRAPLYDRLLATEGKERRTEPFELTGSDDPLGRVVRLYQADVDARVAAAELGLGSVAEMGAGWPPEQAELRNASDQPLPRSRWAGEDGNAVIAEYVRTLKLGVPRAGQFLH